MMTLLSSLYIVSVSAFAGTVRIMPLGDSITQGTDSGVPGNELQVSYRKALLDLLVNYGYDVDFVGSLNSGSVVFESDYPGMGQDLADHEGVVGRRGCNGHGIRHRRRGR